MRFRCLWSEVDLAGVSLINSIWNGFSFSETFQWIYGNCRCRVKGYRLWKLGVGTRWLTNGDYTRDGPIKAYGDKLPMTNWREETTKWWDWPDLRIREGARDHERRQRPDVPSATTLNIRHQRSVIVGATSTTLTYQWASVKDRCVYCYVTPSGND